MVGAVLGNCWDNCSKGEGKLNISFFDGQAGFLARQTLQSTVRKLKRGCNLTASTYHMVLSYSSKFDLRMLVSTFS